jgi:DNA invertase Pin-like site-specific DNA recombinase
LKATDELTNLGLERQSEDTLALCERRGWEVVRTYSDPGVSAAEGKHRTDFEQAMTDLRERTIDVLVVKSLDRLTRSLADLLVIERVLADSGGALVSVAEGDLDTTTATGKFMLRQRAMVAEMYLEDVRAKVTRWHEQRAHAGKPLVSGRRPFGYATKDRSTVDPVEADVIVRAAAMLLAGKSLNHVTAWVNDLGVRAPNGKPWRPPNLRQMLVSPGIAGLRYYHGAEVATGKWEPILDRLTWESLVARFNATKGTPGRPPTHLLSGLVRCGRCGHPMHAKYSQRGRQLACRTRPGQPNCGRIVIMAAPVELLVSERILDRLAGKRLGRAFGAFGDAKVDVAAAELQAAEVRRDEIETMFEEGVIERDEYLRMRGPARDRVERAHRALASVTGRSVLADLPSGAEALRAWWYKPARTTEERRAVIQAVLREVTIQPSGPRMSRFDPERVQIPREAWRV